MTPPQTSVSLVMKVLASAALLPAARRLMAAKCAFASGLLRTSTIALLSLATIAGGVFGGAAMAFQVPDSNPFTPASLRVGMLGKFATRADVATARMRALPPW